MSIAFWLFRWDGDALGIVVFDGYGTGLWVGSGCDNSVESVCLTWRGR
jgi:hypothetical protein